jgi:hypothetical protein
VAQDRASELSEEAFDEVEPGAVFSREGECEAANANALPTYPQQTQKQQQAA